MAENVQSIRSLILPIGDHNLLIPTTVVAEVVGHTPPERAGAGPAWLLGHVTWRGQSVPCVAFEVLGGGAPLSAGARARTVVLKAVGGRSGMPYIALRTDGIPRLVNVERDGVERQEDGRALPGVSDAVLTRGESALIPDLDSIEAWTLKALQGH